MITNDKKDNKCHICSKSYVEKDIGMIAFRMNMVAFKGYGHPKKCHQKWRREKDHITSKSKKIPTFYNLGR